MSALLSLSNLSLQFGSQALFNSLSFSMSEKDKIGVIGPNGAGKSTLMKIIAGEVEADSGNILKKTGLQICYTPQTANFAKDQSIYDYALNEASKYFHNESEAERVARNSLAKLEFKDFTEHPKTFSGGQKKRLQLALALCSNADLLILDEPTNHLDLESIIFLEELLKNASFSWLVVTHDRQLLEKAANRIIEINPYYENGLFSNNGNYESFLQKREEFRTAEEKRISSMANIARREQEWLRQGVKARTTKAKYRIDSAKEVIKNVAEAKARTKTKNINISFSGTQKESKRLVELVNVSKKYDKKEVIKDLTFDILGKKVIGLLGRNGSGKTTLIKLISSQEKPDSGKINSKNGLSIVHFQQIAEDINTNTNLKSLFSEDGDSVVFRNESIHVAAWARKFNFSHEQLNQPYGSLSGGEKARARIAKLMLTNADLLILDEPTNDLDIETIEILEESILDFDGAVILVTHDRYMISRVCDSYIGLDGNGGWNSYATYEQWQSELSDQEENLKKDGTIEKQKDNKLTKEQRKEINSIERKITKSEAEIKSLEEKLAKNPEEYIEIGKKIAEEQKKIEELYAKWEEFEC